MATKPHTSKHKNTSQRNNRARKPVHLLQTINPCVRCKGLCCKYYALQIDTPEDEDDYDDIRWYLYHTGSRVFIEDDRWFLEVKALCRNLTQDYQCALYDKRPRICRQYGKAEDGQINCHLADDAEFAFEKIFSAPEEIEAYARKKLGKRLLGWERKKSVKKRTKKKVKK